MTHNSIVALPTSPSPSASSSATETPLPSLPTSGFLSPSDALSPESNTKLIELGGVVNYAQFSTEGATGSPLPSNSVASPSPDGINTL